MTDPNDLWPPRDFISQMLRGRAVESDRQSLFTRLYPWMVATLQSRLTAGTPPAVAKDLVANVWVNWGKLMGAFDPGRAEHVWLPESVGPEERLVRAFRKYLYSALMNAFRSWNRQETRLAATREPLVNDVPSDEASPPTAYDDAELSAVLHSLSDEEQRLLRMKFWEEMTFAEIATATGRSPSKTYRLIREAIHKLESRLRPWNPP